MTFFVKQICLIETMLHSWDEVAIFEVLWRFIKLFL